MRFFHDFITVSFPQCPLNSEHAWTKDVPIIAQEHEFLMHAILALGASHLHANTNIDLKQTVERHRAAAMRGLIDVPAEHVVTESRFQKQNGPAQRSACDGIRADVLLIIYGRFYERIPGLGAELCVLVDGDHAVRILFAVVSWARQDHQLIRPHRDHA